MAFFAFTRLMAVCSALALAWILGHHLPRFRRGLRHASILCEWCDCRIPVCLGDNAPSSRVNEIQRAGAVKGGPTEADAPSPLFFLLFRLVLIRLPTLAFRKC